MRWLALLSLLVAAPAAAQIGGFQGSRLGSGGPWLSTGGGTLTGALTLDSGHLTLGLNQRLVLDDDLDSYWVCAADDTCGIWTGGVEVVDWTSAIIDFNRTTRMQARGFVPAKVTADPCGAASNYPEASIFYNDTSNYWCGCDEAGADVKLSDGTACF